MRDMSPNNKMQVGSEKYFEEGPINLLGPEEKGINVRGKGVEKKQISQQEQDQAQ